MKNEISTLHRIFLWIPLVTGIAFGLAFYLAPEASNQFLGVYAPDPIAIRCIGGFLLAAALGAGLALKSGLWNEVRLVTYYLMTWGILNSLALFYWIFFSGQRQASALLPNAIISGVMGLGLAFVAWQRRKA